MALTAETPLTRKRLVRVKLETNKGEAVTTDQYCVAYDLTCEPDNTLVERLPGSASLSPEARIVAQRTGTCSFRTELVTDHTSDLLDAVEILLQCCGWTLSTHVFSPSATVAAGKTCTINVWEDGKKKQLTGCCGNAVFTFEAGGIVGLEFAMKGVWAAVTDEALPTPTISAYAPTRAASATFALHSLTPSIGSMRFSLNTDVQPIEDITAAAGVAYFACVNRAPGATLDPEAALVATHDYYGKWLAGTEAALSLVFTDASVTTTVAAPKVQYIGVAGGDRSSKAIHNLECQFNRSATSGNDEITITTAAA